MRPQDYTIENEPWRHSYDDVEGKIREHVEKLGTEQEITKKPKHHIIKHKTKLITYYSPFKSFLI